MKSKTNETALGSNLNEQKETLYKAYHLLETMKFTGGEKLFDKGAMMAINCAISLQEYLQKNYNIPTLKCVNMTQCFVERHFGDTRAGYSDKKSK